MIRRPPSSTRTDTLFPYTTLFRSDEAAAPVEKSLAAEFRRQRIGQRRPVRRRHRNLPDAAPVQGAAARYEGPHVPNLRPEGAGVMPVQFLRRAGGGERVAQLAAAIPAPRPRPPSDERRGGDKRVSTYKYWWSPYH